MAIKSVLTFSLFLLPLTLARAEVVADSSADFNRDGEQGAGGWSYGYRLVEDDDDRENYDPTESFILFDEDDGWLWTGAKWDWGGGNVPWTEVSASGGHPNGTNNGAEHWVVRRWEADILSEQALALTWHLHKTNTNGGNGVSGAVHLNGQRTDFASVAGNDGVGFDRTVYAYVRPGDFIDFALLPEGEDGNPVDGADGSSFSIVVDTDIPPNPTQPDGTPFIVPTAADEDEDGLPDSYEEAFFPGDLSKLSATGDADEDRLTDLQEFEGGTDPTDADTDADGFSDGEEVAEGTDPGNPADNAGIIADSLEDWNVDGEHDPEGWSSGYRNLSQDGGGEDYDARSAFIPFTADEGWIWTGTAWDWGDGNVPWTVVGGELTHPNGTGNGDLHWTIRRWAPQLQAVTPLALIWEVRKQNLNCGQGVTGSLHINGERVDFLTIANDDGAGEVRTFYADVEPGDLIDLALSPFGTDDTNNDGCDGSFTRLKVSRGIPAQAQQPDGSPFVPASATDSDGDGLPDPWEEIYSPGDLSKLTGDGDFDEDGSPDAAEFERSTDPTKEDSDGDHLSDGVETGTGTFVSATDTGTNPTKADTDGDGLRDGEEIGGDPATDPTAANTDGDCRNDKEELEDGSDPNDPLDSICAGVIAESEDDWSREGVQGENNWFYGYRNLTEEGDVERIDYDPRADFIHYPGEWWNGNIWDFPEGNVPWTSHSALGTHPNGENNGALHWSIRRWEADVDEPTAIAIRWLTTKANTACGNGVTGAIHHNGVRIDSVLVKFNDNKTAERVVYANVEPGDFIDLINSPWGENNAGEQSNNDGCDGSHQWMNIGTRIPDPAIQPDGSIFEPIVLGDPSLSFLRRSPFGQLGNDPGKQERTVTLKNAGETKELTITSATLAGPDGDHYSLDLQFPLTLAPETSIDLVISFDPQDRDGGFLASLDFTSTDEKKPNRSLDLSAHIPDRNQLVAWYKLDETEGTRMSDASGNENHGIYVSNGATIALAQPGIAGGHAVGFVPAGPAEAPYAEVADFPVLQGGFTISMWFQAHAALNTVAAGIISKSRDAPGHPFALASSDNQLNWFGDGADSPDVPGSDLSAVKLEQTQHVAIIYDPAGPSVQLYVDGKLAGTGLEDAAVTDVEAALQIGAVNGAAGFHGLVDDVQIYGKPLAADDVVWLHANPGLKLGQTTREPDPTPSDDFRTSLSALTKTESGISVGNTLAPAKSYAVEYSKDLVDWEVIAEGVSGEVYEDTDATRSGRAAGYYRLRQ